MKTCSDEPTWYIICKVLFKLIKLFVKNDFPEAGAPILISAILSLFPKYLLIATRQASSASEEKCEENI